MMIIIIIAIVSIYSVYQIMLVLLVFFNTSSCFVVPTWSTFLVHYFLHSNKHTTLSSQHRTTTIVVIVLSLEAHVLSLLFFLFEPTYTSNECSAWSTVLAMLHTRSLSLVFALVLYTLGSMAAPHHRFMVTCLMNIHAQDTRPEMNILLSKQEKFFCSMSTFFSMTNHCFVGYSIQCIGSLSFLLPSLFFLNFSMFIQLEKFSTMIIIVLCGYSIVFVAIEWIPSFCLSHNLSPSSFSLFSFLLFLSVSFDYSSVVSVV